MTDERELDDGLAAFDRLGREMGETNRLLRTVQSDQDARSRQERTLSAEMQNVLKQATEASQTALQTSQIEMRSSATLDRSNGLPDRSGGVWRGIFLRSAGRNRKRAGGRISESPEPGSGRKLGEHPGRTASLWPRSTRRPRYVDPMQGRRLDYGVP